MSLELNIYLAPEDTISFHKNIDKAILKALQSKLPELKEYIFDSLADKDGGPSIENTTIENLRFDQITFTGSCRISFAIERRFCCSDVSSCHKDYIDLKLELQDNNLKLTGTYQDWSLID